MTLSVLAAHIPDELRKGNRWVCWRMENKDGRLTKIPYVADDYGQRAKSSDNKTWRDFTTALMGYSNGGNFDGIGIMLADGDISVIDLDHCRDAETGVIDDWAQQIITDLASFTEISPSGTGVHIFVRGTPPEGRRRKGMVEMYGPKDNRYITVTGRRVHDASIQQKDLSDVHAKLFPHDRTERATRNEAEFEEKGAADTMSPADRVSLAEDLIEKALNGEDGSLVQELLFGDYKEHWPEWSDSEARMSLLNRLARYTDDAKAIEAVVRLSSLMKEKLDGKRGERTLMQQEIAKAIAERPTQGIQRIGSLTGPKSKPKASLSIDDIRSARASSVAPGRVKWLWKPWLPVGKLTMLDGDPGIGKSYIGLDLAARVSTGRPMPPTVGPRGSTSKHGVVLLMPEDDLADTIIPRLIALEADLDRIMVISSVFDVTAESGLEILRAVVDEVSAGLVVFDPILTYLGGEKTDVHKDRDVRRALDPLVALAAEKQLSIVANRHLAKAGRDAGPAIYRGMGSIALTAVSRVALMVANNPETGQGKVLTCVKNNLAPKPRSLAYDLEDAGNEVAKITWLGESNVTADQLGSQRKDTEHKVDAAEELITTTLTKHGKVPAKFMVEEASDLEISRATLYRAADKLGVIRYRDGNPFNGLAMWRLKDSEDLVISQDV